jgi:hypothetical protein
VHVCYCIADAGKDVQHGGVLQQVGVAAHQVQQGPRAVVQQEEAVRLTAPEGERGGGQPTQRNIRRRHSTAQHSTAQHSTAQHSTAAGNTRMSRIS